MNYSEEHFQSVLNAVNFLDEQHQGYLVIEMMLHRLNMEAPDGFSVTVSKDKTFGEIKAAGDGEVQGPEASYSDDEIVVVITPKYLGSPVLFGTMMPWPILNPGTAMDMIKVCITAMHSAMELMEEKRDSMSSVLDEIMQIMQHRFEDLN